MKTAGKTAARLIAVDWGTSNLRVSLLGAGGALVGQRSAASGIMAVPGGNEGRFADALTACAGDWIDAHRVPLIASGMIGSRQGWREAPYAECPARLDDVAAHLTRVDVRAGVVLHIVPGLRCIGADGIDDVMRGEETQLWGADLPPGRCCVLPGTHSKWAWMGDAGKGGDSIATFQTHMTGELYALLRQHSILGRLMPQEPAHDGAHDGAQHPPQHGPQHTPSPQAFERGVQLGLHGHASLLHTVFAARTAGLMERLPAAALPDYLSGVLIGAEIGGATRGARPTHITLLGDDALCTRYAAALHIAGIASDGARAGATVRGQWRIALQAGLVTEEADA